MKVQYNNKSDNWLAHFQEVIGMKKKLSKRNGKVSVKSKAPKLARKSKAARYPLSNEKLESLGAKHRPAPSWYEEDELP